MLCFGDAVTVRTATSAQLAVYLWRPGGCEPAIFLGGRVVHLGHDAILRPWKCPTCRGSRIFWAVRIPPRCAVCHPPTTVEREHLFSYAVVCVKGLAAKLDDSAAKTAMHRLLDEAVASGNLLKQVELALECLAGGFILKHELDLGDEP